MKADRHHFEPQQLERFLFGETSRAENRAVVRHLLRGCLECREAAGTTWYLTEPAQVRLALPEAGTTVAVAGRSV